MIDYIIIGAIIIILIAIIYSGIKKKKNGLSGCGCSGCGSCPSHGDCHDDNNGK